MSEKHEKLIDKKGIRLDGRKADELRPLKLQVGVLPNADGSAYIEHGKNKILVGVFGPHRVGELKRIEKICQRIDLHYRKPGRPKKAAVIQTPDV